MEKRYLIFNGDDEVEVTIGQLRNLDIDTAVAFFESTAVYRDILKDIESGHSVVGVNGRTVYDQQYPMINNGYHALVDRMTESLGEDSCMMIVAKVSAAILLEKSDN
jgi:hypothetical protein